jgi:L-cysteine/cystine lyase
VSWADARARFPVLERAAYLNAGTFGPLSRATVDALAELAAWEAENGRGGREYFEAMLARRDRVRALLASQVGVAPEHVALTESTTQGVHVVVTGLALRPEDEIVTTDVEHFGLIGPLIASGARVRVARVRAVAAADVFDAIRSQVTPRTRLIALSHVSWIDGRLLPWRELRDETAVPVLVDGAQSAGAIEVDAREADFYTVSAQKWLCAPAGTGALAVGDPDALPLRLVGYPSQQDYSVEDATFVPKPGAARFDPAFTPAPSLAGLEAALSDLPEGRFERARELTERFREALLGEGIDVVTEPAQGTLVSWRTEGDTAATAAALYESGVVLRDLPGTGLLRASVGWWNDEHDLERLLDALPTAAARIASAS